MKKLTWLLFLLTVLSFAWLGVRPDHPIGNGKRVVIVHGWKGSPKADWLPWLRLELKHNSFTVVIIPTMPNPARPQLSQWLEELSKDIGLLDENTYLVGHSLGANAILHYLSSGPEGKASKVILVAGFTEPLNIGQEELKSFFGKDLNYENIKKSADDIVLINADDDPYVPLEQGIALSEKLNCRLVVLHGFKHFNDEAGVKELPIVLEEILK